MLSVIRQYSVCIYLQLSAVVPHNVEDNESVTDFYNGAQIVDLPLSILLNNGHRG